jgi:aryl-alcohol dehydrogenase-like predicted oxidoreductase
LLRSWEARELRQGIEDNLRALGTGRLAVVNLRVMDPSETPGRRFDAQLADLAPNVLLIPGTRTRAHLAENLASADVKLDDDARAELAGTSRKVRARTR